jgi:uncharacterized protein
MTTQPLVAEPTIKVIQVGPTAQDERIGPLDVLRGFALLGILIVNVQLFAMPLAAYLNPTVWGDLTGGNYLAWLLIHLLGRPEDDDHLLDAVWRAGIVLFSVTARGRSAARLHYRRNFLVAPLRIGAWLPVVARRHLATSEKLDDEVAAYRRGWLAQMGHRVPATVEFQTLVLPVWGFWRAAGLMLMGRRCSSGAF